jgi:glucosamine 6-phosphate synthetase-like amidotransferase/phosphosugar isomerase protein
MQIEFGHHMFSEIYEMPKTILDTLAGRIARPSGTVTLEELPFELAELRTFSRIRIVGSGTSRYAGLFGKYVIEELAGIPVDVDYSSEVEQRRISCCPAPLSIFLSQSGETSDSWRRYGRSSLSSGHYIQLGPFQIDQQRQEIKKDGDKLKITGKVFALKCKSIV